MKIPKTFRGRIHDSQIKFWKKYTMGTSRQVNDTTQDIQWQNSMGTSKNTMGTSRQVMDTTQDIQWQNARQSNEKTWDIQVQGFMSIKWKHSKYSVTGSSDRIQDNSMEILKTFSDRIHDSRMRGLETYILIERTPPPRGGFLFTMFPDQEPGGRGPSSKNLYQVLRGGSSSSGFLIREHSFKKKTRVSFA